VQVWVKGPSDAQDKAITGTFTDPSFTGTFDWIFQGTTTFNLYDVGVNPKQLLASATAIGNK